MTSTAATVVLLALAAAPATAQLKWLTAASTGAPSALCGYAWDSGRARLLAFGGTTALGAAVGTTHEWNGSAWQVRSTAAAPSPRSRAAMAYDAARGVTVLFGGDLGPGFSNQTWTFDGTNWTQRAPATVPPARFGAAMAYDTVRRVVVMFGGFVPAGTDTADLWEWDGSNWTQRVTTGAAPLPRGAHRWAFDEARGQFVLHGGFRTLAAATVADSWSYDGTRWTLLPTGPASLCDNLLVYDQGRRRIVLFGGLTIQGPIPVDRNETWEWNGSTWSQRLTAVTPSARSGMANAYHPQTGQILLAGGTTFAGARSTDTWSLVPSSPAQVTAFGSGCTATTAVSLDAVSLPYLGGSFVQRLTGPAAATLGLVLLGKSDTTAGGLPLPLDLGLIGAPGCQLAVSMEFQQFTALTGGAATITWPIASDLAWLGVTMFTQGVVVDPGSTAALPIAMSSGRRCRVGAP